MAEAMSTAQPQKDSRKRMFAAIAIRRKHNRLDDATYRALVEKVTVGRTTSTKECTMPELYDLLNALPAKTAVHIAKKKGAWSPPKHRDQRFIYGLWRDLCRADSSYTAGEASCDRFAAGIIGAGAPASVRFLDRAQCYQVIEVLKKKLDKPNAD